MYLVLLLKSMQNNHSKVTLINGLIQSYSYIISLRPSRLSRKIENMTTVLPSMNKAGLTGHLYGTEKTIS